MKQALLCFPFFCNLAWGSQHFSQYTSELLLAKSPQEVYRIRLDLEKKDEYQRVCLLELESGQIPSHCYFSKTQLTSKKRGLELNTKHLDEICKRRVVGAKDLELLKEKSKVTGLSLSCRETINKRIENLLYLYLEAKDL